jgi:alpha-galactosidase/6-phospho-beta-glucosidase family protein
LPASIDTFRSDLEKLTRRFEADQQFYLSKDYLEAQARVDFVTPFFKALGCDVEQEMDELVCELYGVTAKEQKLLERR